MLFSSLHRALSWIIRKKTVCKCKYNEAAVN